MRLVYFLFLSFFINAHYPVKALPWISSEEDKRICREISADVNNDFSAELFYKACLKERKKVEKNEKDRKKEELLINRKLEKEKNKENKKLNLEKKIFLRYCKKYISESNRNNYGLISPDLKVGDILYKSFEGEPVYVKEGQIEKGLRNFRKWRYAKIQSLKNEMKRKHKISDFRLDVLFEVWMLELPLPYYGKIVHIRECEKLFKLGK